MKFLKIAACAFGGAGLASLGVLIVEIAVYGSDVYAWPEADGRLIGVLVTIAGVLGAGLGMFAASRAERRYF
jgi:hypothetical protein